jgi:hypothetical protein
MFLQRAGLELMDMMSVLLVGSSYIVIKDLLYLPFFPFKCLCELIGV